MLICPFVVGYYRIELELAYICITPTRQSLNLFLLAVFNIPAFSHNMPIQTSELLPFDMETHGVAGYSFLRRQHMRISIKQQVSRCRAKKLSYFPISRDLDLVLSDARDYYEPLIISRCQSRPDLFHTLVFNPVWQQLLPYSWSQCPIGHNK
jgi:hypothetical protein